MRNLKTSDIFRASKIISKMGLKIENDKDKTKEQVGTELLMSFIENLWKAEDDVNEFLADLAGITKEEFASLPISKSAKIITEFKNQPDIVNFLHAVGKSKK